MSAGELFFGDIDQKLEELRRESAYVPYSDPKAVVAIQRAAGGGGERDCTHPKPVQQDGNAPSLSLRANKSWVCAQSHELGATEAKGPNAVLTEGLQALEKEYKATGTDQFKSRNLKRTIARIKKLPYKLESPEQVAALGLGGKTEAKVIELVLTGGLQRLESLKTDEAAKAQKLFESVWGVGQKTAESFVGFGWRSLDDLHAHCDQLTDNQKVGLKLYDELAQRMGRAEVEAIFRVVKAAAQCVCPGVLVEACGSFRRGKPTCGDVDVLVTHAGGRSPDDIYPELLRKLSEDGFLKHDLTTSSRGVETTQRKYMGVCRLPGANQTHRRLDIIVVPYEEYPCARLYFTGSGHFNRSMRALAGKNRMSLSQHALMKDVSRHKNRLGEVVKSEGVPVPIHSEADVFKALGLEYRAPEARNAG